MIGDVAICKWCGRPVVKVSVHLWQHTAGQPIDHLATPIRPSEVRTRDHAPHCDEADHNFPDPDFQV